MGEGKDANVQLELAEKGIQVAKQVEMIDAVDRNAAKIVDAAGDLVAGKMQPKKTKGEIIAERFPDVVDAADAGTANIVTAISDIIVKYIGDLPEIIKAELKKDHGSKVKVGRFHDCSIVFAGTKSCIVVDAEQHELVYLTPECVLRSRYVEKKFRPTRAKTYYYYELVFKDGTESYVRVSEKHRQNLESCGLQNTTKTIFKMLPSGEECGIDGE
ncbi:hypothetical protein D1159_13400 [Pseudoflavonifractor sp. 524-17]|uniref:hypothetical protein n=1 Tax=Pseudoflavonifractor sp. 524-17 TaxID=2304577 RepID=UPI00137B1CD9|nr:hypothetical protein [Pseudoflavonifractor sp. 524-17]NCE65548.1 hypothetical protein [Pseudoflavonifractor sp. 524-17]